MTGEVVAARSHPAVVIAMVVAAIAVTALALVVIAYMLGWIPANPAGPSPVSVALPGSQVAGSAPDAALLPGESVVEAPPVAAPAPEPAPAPAPQPYAPPASRSGSPAPSYTAPAPRPAPKKPTYARPEPPPPVTSYDRAAKSICINCGTVASIVNSSGDWEVRLRFEDGSSDTLRYQERPRVRVGDKVYVENGRLMPD